MYLILVYDINIERVTKVMKLCREFLEHIQNSVFEGEITKSNLEELKIKLKKIINPAEDSILIFEFRTKKELIKEVIGKEKNQIENLI